MQWDSLKGHPCPWGALTELVLSLLSSRVTLRGGGILVLRSWALAGIWDRWLGQMEYMSPQSLAGRQVSPERDAQS